MLLPLAPFVGTAVTIRDLAPLSFPASQDCRPESYRIPGNNCTPNRTPALASFPLSLLCSISLPCAALRYAGRACTALRYAGRFSGRDPFLEKLSFLIRELNYATVPRVFS